MYGELVIIYNMLIYVIIQFREVQFTLDLTFMYPDSPHKNVLSYIVPDKNEAEVNFSSLIVANYIILIFIFDIKCYDGVKVLFDFLIRNYIYN